jgi:hypothetical protein
VYSECLSDGKKMANDEEQDVDGNTKQVNAKSDRMWQYILIGTLFGGPVGAGIGAGLAHLRRRQAAELVPTNVRLMCIGGLFYIFSAHPYVTLILTLNALNHQKLIGYFQATWPIDIFVLNAIGAQQTVVDTFTKTLGYSNAYIGIHIAAFLYAHLIIFSLLPVVIGYLWSWSAQRRAERQGSLPKIPPETLAQYKKTSLLGGALCWAATPFLIKFVFSGDVIRWVMTYPNATEPWNALSKGLPICFTILILLTAFISFFDVAFILLLTRPAFTKFSTLMRRNKYSEHHTDSRRNSRSP